MCHGLNLPVIAVFGRAFIVTTCWDLSLFISCLWDSSESNPIDLWMNQPYSISITLPPLATILFALT